MKKTASKGDKKKKKEVTEEIAKLEADLDQKHERELQELKSAEPTTVEQVSSQLESTELEESEGAARQSRVSKAQKRREKKAQKNKLTQEEIER